jgi:hypothetical protein
LAQGATALTEAWDANPNSSQDHFMLGHAEEWFYRGLGGIHVDFSAPAERRLVIRPNLVGKLTSVQTRYVSIWGPIESNWHRGTAQTEYEMTIPANTTATVELSISASQGLRVNGEAPDRADGVKSANVESARAVLVLGSGHYAISAPNPQNVH